MADEKRFTQHISRQYNEDLTQILNQVMRMGGLVERQLADALVALTQGDSARGEQVVASDYQVNAAEVKLDEDCTHILARRQPAASDLRLIIAVIKTITDLERIGDEAERVGRMALNLLDEDRRHGPMAQMQALGDHVRRMLAGALDAFTRMDADKAVQVTQQDNQIDNQYNNIIRDLINAMRDDPAAVPRAMDAIWSARALERIGDRSCNICEYVVYFVHGKDVRHTSFGQMSNELTGERH